MSFIHSAPRVAKFSPAFNEFTCQGIRCSVVQCSSFPLHQTRRSPVATLLYLHWLFSLQVDRSGPFPSPVATA